MTNHRSRKPKAPGEEVRDALADVLHDVAEGYGVRQEVKDRSSRPPRVAGAFLVVVVLAGLNVWRATARPDGPDPAEEALHSSEEARRECRAALDSRLAGQDFEIASPLVVEYLQGGEYRGTGTVDLAIGDGRTLRHMVCEIQFTAEAGWTVEYVELGAG